MSKFKVRCDDDLHVVSALWLDVDEHDDGHDDELDVDEHEDDYDDDVSAFIMIDNGSTNAETLLTCIEIL